jgi:hypothetical protein
MASKKNHHSADFNQQPAGTAAPGTDAGAATASQRRGAKDAAATAKSAKTPPQKAGAKIKAGGKTKAGDKAQAKAPRDKKLSALNAAAKVLQEACRSLNCQEMIADMAQKGYWSSPQGKTPAATLYSALLREIKTKGTQARFQKTARGQFVYQTPQAS